MCLSLGAGQLRGALAFRAELLGDPGPAPEKVPKVCNVPESVDTFRRSFEGLYEGEGGENLTAPLDPSIRLVLGVLTIAQDDEYRQVVRQTWMRRAGVCYWRSTPQENCSVYVAFVLGRTGGGATDGELARAHREEGAFVLDIPENLMEGKSFDWLRAAREKFPWATHIGKTDMDAYPFISKLVGKLAQGRSCAMQGNPYEFIGLPWPRNCTFPGKCPKARCAAPYAEELPRCFLIGQLYILSLPLVQEMALARLVGSEDQMVTIAVKNTMRRLSSCAAVWDIEGAWIHMPWGRQH